MITIGRRIKAEIIASCLCLVLTASFAQADTVKANETTSQNLNQASLTNIEKMPNAPSNFKVIDWLDRGIKLNDFVFDYTATNFQEKSEFSVIPGRTFSTIYRDDRYGGYMIPAFYGENRPLVDNTDKNHYGADDQESISVTSALLAASLMGVDMNTPLPDELKGTVSEAVKDPNSIDFTYDTYLDNALKFFWTKNGTNIFTNVPNGSMSELQNMKGAYQAFDDFWYMLIANQNFFRLAELNPDWRPELTADLEEKTADKMVEMVDNLGGANCDFNIQGYDMMNMKVVTTANRKQPDGAVGTANILYYAYKIFNDTKPEKAQKYLTYSKYCMNYIDSLERNPYYENMLIDAVYLSTMMNAEQNTNYDTSKYINWITTLSGSSVRNWGGVGYTQDGLDVYGLTGEGNSGYSYFFNSIYPMTSILPASKYDPSYARMAGKWAINIVNSSKYFLPDEWDESHQTDGNYITEQEGSLMAYESLKKNSNGINFFATGDAKQNATSGWWAGANTTNFGLYGGFYTGFLGALVETTNVDNILKLDCNKTDYYQNDMYQTYLYYNPNEEAKSVTIDLGDEHYDLYDSVTGTYVAKNVTGSQSFKILSDSAKVIVLAPANSTREIRDEATYINNQLVSKSNAERLPEPGNKPVAEITIEGEDNFSFKGQQQQFKAIVTPTDVEDSRVKWSVLSKDGEVSEIATVDSNGLVSAKQNGTAYLVAKAIDGSEVIGKKEITITGQEIPAISLNKKVTVSSHKNGFDGDLVVDGDLSTRWIAGDNDNNPWLYVDLEHEVNIQSIELNWEAARPPKYIVQVSDDAKNWQTLKSFSDSGNTAEIVTIQPESDTSGRYVRVYTEEKSKWGASLYELSVQGTVTIENEISSIRLSSDCKNNTVSTKNYPVKFSADILPANATDKRVIWSIDSASNTESPLAKIDQNGIVTPLGNGRIKVIAEAVDGSGVKGELELTMTNQDSTNLALNKSVTATYSESGNIPKNVNDGNKNSRWASGRQNANDSITIDLGETKEVNKVVLYWEAAYAKGYKIQGSTDGETFNDLYVNQDGKGSNEIISFEKTNARYVRMQGTKNLDSLGYSLWEFEIYNETDIMPDSLTLNCTSLTTLKVNKKLQIKPTISPENAESTEITWSIDKPNIATVDEHNVITGLKPGITKVTATTVNGKTASFTLRVTQ